MLRSSHPLWNVRASNEGEVCQLVPKIGYHIEPLHKEGGTDHAHPMFTYPENLVKIGPVHSEITGL